METNRVTQRNWPFGSFFWMSFLLEKSCFSNTNCVLWSQRGSFQYTISWPGNFIYLLWQKLQNHSLKKSSRATKTQLAFCSSNLSKETPNLQGWIQLLHLWIYKKFLDVSSENFHDKFYRSVIRKVCRDP